MQGGSLDVPVRKQLCRQGGGCRQRRGRGRRDVGVDEVGAMARPVGGRAWRGEVGAGVGEEHEEDEDEVGGQVQGRRRRKVRGMRSIDMQDEDGGSRGEQGGGDDKGDKVEAAGALRGRAHVAVREGMGAAEAEERAAKGLGAAMAAAVVKKAEAMARRPLGCPLPRPLGCPRPRPLRFRGGGGALHNSVRPPTLL